jgi:hypothetical protein
MKHPPKIRDYRTGKFITGLKKITKHFSLVLKTSEKISRQIEGEIFNQNLWFIDFQFVSRKSWNINLPFTVSYEIVCIVGLLMYLKIGQI